MAVRGEGKGLREWEGWSRGAELVKPAGDGTWNPARHRDLGPPLTTMAGGKCRTAHLEAVQELRQLLLLRRDLAVQRRFLLGVLLGLGRLRRLSDDRLLSLLLVQLAGTQAQLSERGVVGGWFGLKSVS